MFLGRNIRAIRKKWGWKQEEFGEKFDVKGQSVSTYEKGTTEPRLQFLIKLSEMSGINLNDLLTRPLQKDELPDAPLYGPHKAMPLQVHDPMEIHELLRPEDIAEPLYNIHILVAEFKKLRERVEELEKMLGEEEE